MKLEPKPLCQCGFCRKARGLDPLPDVLLKAHRLARRAIRKALRPKKARP